MNRQRIAPQTLSEQTASAFKHQAELKDVTLQVTAELGLPDIAVDGIRMAQVLGNLVSNTLRYTPEGGQIALVARRRSQQIEL